MHEYDLRTTVEKQCVTLIVTASGVLQKPKDGRITNKCDGNKVNIRDKDGYCLFILEKLRVDL